MFSCGCGRDFKSGGALERHKQDKAKLGLATSCTPSKPRSVAPTPSPGSGLQNSPQIGGQSTASMSGTSKLKRQVTRNQWMFKDAGRNIDTIKFSSIKPADTPVTSSAGHELICSYNWANQKEPMIYVPGKFSSYCSGAAVWKEVNVPITIPKDSGIQFIDQNASRIPKYPFEVVFQAIEIMRPSLRFDAVDILINRNTLRKLLDFSHGRNQDSFRINLYTVQNTLIIERCEKSAKQMIRGSGGSGYGHNFERKFTQSPSGLENSVGHHRVLRYSLGYLSCAVRFEVDACYEDPEQTEPPEMSKAPQGETISLVDSLKVMQVRAPKSNSKLSSHSSAHTIPRGTITEQSSMAEIKTRLIKKGSPLSKTLPQLWFGRTPHLITGYHSDGVFERVDISHVETQLVDWEEKKTNQNALRKLTSLLSQLREIVKNTEEKACVAICERGAKPLALNVFVEKKGRKPLPEEVVARYWEAK